MWSTGLGVVCTVINWGGGRQGEGRKGEARDGSGGQGVRCDQGQGWEWGAGGEV